MYSQSSVRQSSTKTEVLINDHPSELAEKRNDIPQSMHATDMDEVTRRLLALEKHAPTDLSELDRQQPTTSPRVSTPDSDTPEDFTPEDLDGPEQSELDEKAERRAYNDLQEDHGRPCYPIELAFEIFRNPGQYDEIISYWTRKLPVDRKTRAALRCQCSRWFQFREYQKSLRQPSQGESRLARVREEFYMRRILYGFDAAEWEEDLAKQSDLDCWTEYQDFELEAAYHDSEAFSDAYDKLSDDKDALKAAGLTYLENVKSMTLAEGVGTLMALGEETSRAGEQGAEAEKLVEQTSVRLEATESNRFSDVITRESWVRLFQEKLNLARKEYTKCERIPFPRKPKSEETESWEEYEKEEKLYQLERYRVEKLQVDADSKRRDAEALLAAADLDIRGPEMPRHALTKQLRDEADVLQSDLTDARKKHKDLELKRAVLSSLIQYSELERSILHTEKLLAWTEQERQILLNESGGGKKNSGLSGGGLAQGGKAPTSDPYRAFKIVVPPHIRTRTSKVADPAPVKSDKSRSTTTTRRQGSTVVAKSTPQTRSRRRKRARSAGPPPASAAQKPPLRRSARISRPPQRLIVA